jgi:ketosteroid isomerase-like protein
MKTIYVVGLSIALCSCGQSSPEKNELTQLHQNYVDAWLANDKKGVLSLFMDDSRLQPSSLCPVKGIKNIEEFWFPNDSSITTIKRFETELLNISIRDTLAFATHTIFLDWSYKKDTVSMNVEQRGVSTSVYRKRKDEWKIWRQMWTDLSSRSY